MNPVSNYVGVLQNFSFQGRARRAEFWWFVLFNIIVSIVLNVVGTMTGLTWAPMGTGPGVGLYGAMAFSIPSLVYSLAVLVQSFALGVRRLHDRGMSGWWLLIAFIPLIGAIVLIIFYALPGNPGANKYGADPKAAV